MLRWAWPSDPATCPPPSEPTPPEPPHHREPTPFAGLTIKPHCDTCAHGAAPRPQAPATPPPRIVPARGAPPGGDRQAFLQMGLGFDHRVGHCAVLHMMAESMRASGVRCLGRPSGSWE